jgi:hypothetical protein
MGKHCLRSIAMIGLLAVAGCGSKEPFAQVPVTGTVIYDDGSLILAEKIRVTFYPQAQPKDAKTHPRPGTADVNVADGSFKEVTSHKFNDGVVAGLQKVTVQTFDSAEMPTDLVPVEYTDVHATPLTYDTASGEPAKLLVKKT